ncbi:CRISPR-associated helicase Cas3' [Enterocloster citroniae]|uniref:CRISPR-associated helicase Cas3 n=1 Tax=Enterocloster citroniae TaxID=358743 RepID=A0AA41FL95_9FIRM|nr:CRISPR-associated helicase Cas3' [Enterocloster citroniae]MBT9813409.1 CRISPR-associated helicase Cas3' [Enterocloster citroniae]MCD8280032.1 CRISPR-associated helicase Cas3' [Enterocloster citroniae]RGC05756.1 CRISPR-associated helicase Cas3' [Enterocloster citroniae]
MKYLAHISEDKQREQSIKSHLEETALLAKEFAEEFGYGEWGYFCGLLHDIGKYSTKFQGRIMGSGEKTDHATAGAQLCLRLGKEKGSYYVAPAYCIAGHHAGLPDTGTSADTGDRGTFTGRMKKRVEDYGAYQEEISIPPLPPPVLSAAEKKDLTFSMSFLIRMLYSCLVDADYLNTEDFMKDGETSRMTGETIPVLLEKLNRHIARWLVNDDQDTINGRRTEILKSCIEKGKKKKGLFRLTVPTGGGKTVASLAFALNHAAEHGMKRIIYVIPYTSIIEQNAKVFSHILGEENVLEHHSGIDYESTDELKLKQLATENWDLPIIVTTNVQFFESLFSNKSSKCRKLHNIANSVIIFDEAQMLPNDYLWPCIASMEELIRHYESSIVLCTATQPSLQNFFPKDMQYTELCPRMEEQFRFFKRAIFKNLGKITEDELLDRVRNEEQALCILNTKNNVQKLYEKIKGEGVYHLSTFMYPRHRQERLEAIRERLAAGEKCIVIATSLVEAGVDLDFQTVYRELAGVDSMIQAAGRCNREGKRDALGSFACYFQLEESRTVPGQEQQIDTAKQVIRRYEDIGSLDAVQEYFTRLYQFKGSALDKKNILEEFQKGRFAFATVGKEFKLIEQNTKTILIPAQERAKEIAEELKLKGANKKLIREAGKYCVNVYENLFRKMYDAGMFVGVSEELKEDFFVLKDCSNYSDETGLQVKAELGMDIWL